MSKNPSIQEGGTPKTISGVSKLQTLLSDGGIQYWVPEDEIQNSLENISITENGTYRAEDYDVVGWRTINVNATVTGTDPDDGEEKTVEVDPETGELVETVLPTSIVITTSPTKTQYNMGDEIDLTGMVVTAYDKLGNVWTNETYTTGVIPVSELSSSPATADKAGEITVSVDWRRPKDSRRLRVFCTVTVATDYVTVTFMNGETVLQVTDNVPYGGTAVYSGETPTKEGYLFTGWLPEPVNVREDLVCYAQFEAVRWTADPEYLLYDADVYLGKVSDRYYYKGFDGQAIAVWCAGMYVSWIGPYIIATDRESAGIVDFNGRRFVANNGPITYAGVNWYFSLGSHMTGGDYESPRPIFTPPPAFNSFNAVALYILETANVRVLNEPLTPTLTLSPSSLALTSVNPTGDVAITTNSDGAITVSSSDPSIASAAVSGTTVRVTAGAATGTATITVSVAATDVYEAASATITVNNGDSSHNSWNF